MSDEVKQKIENLAGTLETITASINKRFGDGSVIVATQKSFVPEVVSTGSLLLDIATGIGGIPLGAIVEFFGNESSGKTTLALSVLGQAQKKGLLTAFIDAEQTISPEWAKVLGVDIDKLLISQPDSIEMGLEIAKALVDAGVQLIVFDSVAAAPTVAEKKGEAGDAVIGQKARIMSKVTSSILSELKKKEATIIFINQIREKVGVVFGNPETTPGGKALKFSAAMRFRLSKRDISESGEKTGAEIIVKIVKNKLAPPFKEATLRLIYGKGFDMDHELYEAALMTGVAVLSGKGERARAIELPNYPGEPKRFSSKKALADAVKENPELREYIVSSIHAALRGEANATSE